MSASLRLNISETKALSTLATVAKNGGVWGGGLEMRILVRSPAHLSVCFCTGKHVQVQTRSTPAHSDIPKALEFLQKRVLNIIFSGGEYETNLIIANVEALSHDDSNSHSFSSDGHELGAWPLGPRLDPPLISFIITPKWQQIHIKYTQKRPRASNQ